MATWIEDIAKALELLGGTAHLSEIYAKVKEIHPGPLPARTHAIIRRAIESNSSDSSGFSGKDIFFSYDGIASRNIASSYLQKLEKIGIVRSEKKGRDVLYVNVRLYNILKK